MVHNYFGKIREVTFFFNLLKFINQIAIEFRIRDTLLQKFVQTDLIVFDQFIVFKVNFENAAEFMIPIALLKEHCG